MNPFETLYDYEKWAIRILTIILLIFGFGFGSHFIGFNNPISDFIFRYFIDSIINETSGDSGYNYVNTAGYGLGLALFVVSLAGILRVAGVDGSDAMLIALLPWVLWAPLGEVVEDAGLFSDSIAPWFVSPGIHFHAAFWVVVAGFIGHRVSVGPKKNTHDAEVSLRHLSALIVGAQAMIYCTGVVGGNTFANNERVIDNEVMWIIALFGVASPYWLAGSNIERFDSIHRMVYSSGVGGSIVLFAILSGYAVQGNGDDLTFWPLFIVIGIPSLICYVIYNIGKEYEQKSADLGYIPGILPPGVTESEYLESEAKMKQDMSKIWRRGVLASPAVLLPVGGQIGDGIATWIGIDYFGYTEKHVVSSMVTDVLDTSITFTILKIGIAGVICWFFSQAVFEYRQQHLRILIALCLMVVGFAPALRNVFRLTLGV